MDMRKCFIIVVLILSLQMTSAATSMGVREHLIWVARELEHDILETNLPTNCGSNHEYYIYGKYLQEKRLLGPVIADFAERNSRYRGTKLDFLRQAMDLHFRSASQHKIPFIDYFIMDFNICIPYAIRMKWYPLLQTQQYNSLKELRELYEIGITESFNTFKDSPTRDLAMEILTDIPTDLKLAPYISEVIFDMVQRRIDTFIQKAIIKEIRKSIVESYMHESIVIICLQATEGCDIGLGDISLQTLDYYPKSASTLLNLLLPVLDKATHCYLEKAKRQKIKEDIGEATRQKFTEFVNLQTTNALPTTSLLSPLMALYIIIVGFFQFLFILP